VRQKARLTPKQQKFVDEYLVDLNATQAAIRAGYSSTNADKIGSQLLGKTRVSEAIQQAMQKRGQRTGVTQDQVIRQLAKVAFLDIRDVVTWDEKSIRIRPSADVDGTVLTEVSETMTESGWTKKIKIADRMRALELLGKHLGTFIPEQERQESMLRAEKLRAEIDKARGVEDSDESDDGFLEALKGRASALWGEPDDAQD
jgi:phage terminase small subunit